MSIETVTGEGYTLYRGDCIDVLRTMPAESVNIIITSPPYNLGQNKMDMGGGGRKSRRGIGYDDDIDQTLYEYNQVAVLGELYRVATPGASLFYNHKPRTLNGSLIHPLRWLMHQDQPWLIRQEIIWDRESTHNHEPTLFWQHDERIFWLTKGKPKIYGSVGRPTIYRRFGPIPNTWHPAPFPLDLPEMLLDAISLPPGATVLDPYAGSGTTINAATRRGYKAIGIDICGDYLIRASKEIRDASRAARRLPKQLTGGAEDYADAPLFAGLA